MRTQTLYNFYKPKTLNPKPSRQLINRNYRAVCFGLCAPILGLTSRRKTGTLEAAESQRFVQQTGVAYTKVAPFPARGARRGSRERMEPDGWFLEGNGDARSSRESPARIWPKTGRFPIVPEGGFNCGPEAAKLPKFGSKRLPARI